MEKFYHAGLSWWKTPTKKRTLGSTRKVSGKKHFIDLISSRSSAVKGLKSGANPRLQGMWSQFIRRVTEAKTKAGKATPFERLSQKSKFLDGFDTGKLKIQVLGPIETKTSSGPGLLQLDSSTSQNTNGHSVMLRVDYGKTRTLLTGDLNKRSQHQLLEDYKGREYEFAADVAKACHHGSEDVSFEFLSKITPGVTVISSGDNEGHDHPRPSIIGASGITGYLTIENDEIVTPMVYSTELARSVSLGDPYELKVSKGGSRKSSVTGAAFDKSDVLFTETKSGALNPAKKKKSLANTYVVAGQVYGLVNVRTDGTRILCATMNEKDGGWETKWFRGRH